MLRSNEIFCKVYFKRQQDSDNGKIVFHHDTNYSSRTLLVLWQVEMFVINLSSFGRLWVRIKDFNGKRIEEKVRLA